MPQACAQLDGHQLCALYANAIEMQMQTSFRIYVLDVMM